MSSKPQPPRFQKGDRVGDLTVIEVITRSHYHPTTKAYLVNAHWWYWCICDCGATEVRNQGSLLRDTGVSKCKECAKNAYQQRAKPKPAEAPTVPDFATMRLK